LKSVQFFQSFAKFSILGSVINFKPTTKLSPRGAKRRGVPFKHLRIANNEIATATSLPRNDTFFVFPRRESSEEGGERREQFCKNLNQFDRRL